MLRILRCLLMTPPTYLTGHLVVFSRHWGHDRLQSGCAAQGVACHWPAQGWQAIAETLSREKIKQWIKTWIGSSQAQCHHHRLLHGDHFWARGVISGLEVQVDGALYVVRHEADQECQKDDDNHSDGFGARVPLASGSVGAGHKGADYADIAEQDDHEGQGKADHQREIVEHYDFLHILTLWWLKALCFIGAGVKMLARHQKGWGWKTDKHPDTRTHQASTVLCHQAQVLHREDDGQESCYGHGSHEVNTAVEVYIEGVGADATEEIPVVPLALSDIVEDSQWQRQDTQQIRYSQVQHEDMEGWALAVSSDQYHQGEAIPKQTQHSDEGVGCGVHLVTEVIDGRTASTVALYAAGHIHLTHRHLLREKSHQRVHDSKKDDTRCGGRFFFCDNPYLILQGRLEETGAFNLSRDKSCAIFLCENDPFLLLRCNPLCENPLNDDFCWQKAQHTHGKFFIVCMSVHQVIKNAFSPCDQWYKKHPVNALYLICSALMHLCTDSFINACIKEIFCRININCPHCKHRMYIMVTCSNIKLAAVYFSLTKLKHHREINTFSFKVIKIKLHQMLLTVEFLSGARMMQPVCWSSWCAQQQRRFTDCSLHLFASYARCHVSSGRGDCAAGACLPQILKVGLKSSFLLIKPSETVTNHAEVKHTRSSRLLLRLLINSRPQSMLQPYKHSRCKQQ